MLISTGGVLIRTQVKSIREMSRSTQGVTLINLDEGEKLAGLERVVETRRRRRVTPGARAAPVARRRPTAPMPRPTTATAARLARHRAAIDALDREILAAPERARDACAGDRRAEGRRRPPTAPSARRRCCRGLHATNAGPLPNEAVTGVFREVMSACLRARADAARRLSRSGRDVQPRGGRRSTSARSSKRCRSRRSTRCFARSRAGRPTTPSCRSRTRPRARSGARSTSCARPTLSICGEVKLRISQNLLSNAGALGAVTQRLFARAVARAMRAMARAASAAACRASRSRATPRPRGSPPREAGRRGDRRRECRRRSTGSRSSRRTSRTSPTTRRASGCSAASRSPPSGRDETSLVMSAPEPAGRRARAARAVREARRVDVALRIAARAHRAAGNTCSSSTSSVTRRSAGGRGAGRARDRKRRSSRCWARILRRLIRSRMSAASIAKPPRPFPLAPDYVRSALRRYIPASRSRSSRASSASIRATIVKLASNENPRGPEPGGAGAPSRPRRPSCHALSRRQRLRAQGRARAAPRRRAGATRARQRQQRRARARDAGVPAAGRRRRVLAARVRRLSARNAGARRDRHRGAGAATSGTTCRRCARRSRRRRASCSSPIRTIPTGTWIAPAALEAFIASVPRDVAGRARRGVQRVPRARASAPKRRAGSRATRISSCRARSPRPTASPRCASATASWMPTVADMLNRVRQPFNVNALAQAAALAALADTAYVEESRALNRAGLRAARRRARARSASRTCRRTATSCWSKVGDAATVYQRAADAGRDRAAGRQLRPARVAARHRRPAGGERALPRRARDALAR